MEQNTNLWLLSELPDPNQELSVGQSIAQFHKFPELPVELRNIIWSFTFPETRRVCLLSHDNTRPHNRPPNPVSSRVNQESRKETLKHYKVLTFFGLTNELVESEGSEDGESGEESEDDEESEFKWYELEPDTSNRKRIEYDILFSPERDMLRFDVPTMLAAASEVTLLVINQDISFSEFLEKNIEVLKTCKVIEMQRFQHACYTLPFKEVDSLELFEDSLGCYDKLEQVRLIDDAFFDYDYWDSLKQECLDDMGWYFQKRKDASGLPIPAIFAGNYKDWVRLDQQWRDGGHGNFGVPGVLDKNGKKTKGIEEKEAALKDFNLIEYKPSDEAEAWSFLQF